MILINQEAREKFFESITSLSTPLEQLSNAMKELDLASKKIKSEKYELYQED